MGLRRLKMATLRCALIFLGCPEEESTPVLVLDTDSQNPHKGPHTFPMSLWRTTMSKHCLSGFQSTKECTEGDCRGKQPLIQG